MNTFSYRITLSYKGSAYFGWQKQPNVRTIQGEVEKALEKMAKSKNILTIGSGRTDAGVHALGQVLRTDLPFFIDPEGLQRGLNGLLEEDINVVDVRQCENSFHPVRDAIHKEYIYLIAPQAPLVFDREFMASFQGDVDFERMTALAKLFEGEWDFCHYMCQGTPVNSTVRTIFTSKLIAPGQFEGLKFTSPFYTYRVVGSGFLKQMVRLMVGTLVKGAQGKLTEKEIVNSLCDRSGKPRHLAPVSPSRGLYLRSVSYSGD